MPTHAQEKKTPNKVSDDLLRKTHPSSDVDVETTPAAIQDKLKEPPFRRTIFHLLGHSPGLFPHLMGVIGGCFDGKTRKIPLYDWHLIVLRTTTTMGAMYAYDVKIPVTEIHEMPRAKIDAMGCSAEDVRNGTGPWTERDRLILSVVDEQLGEYTNDPQTIKDALKVLSVEDLVEILMIMGTYALIVRVIRALETNNDAEIPGLKDMLDEAATSEK